MNDNSDQAVGMFSEAMSLPSAERAAFLARVCGGDAALWARVEALLHAHDEAGDFLKHAPADSPSRSEAPAVIGRSSR